MSDKLSQSEVADKLGVRPSTIKYYTQLVLMPYGRKAFEVSEFNLIMTMLDKENSLPGQNLDSDSTLPLLAPYGASTVIFG